MSGRNDIIEWLREEDPLGEHRLFLVHELRLIVDRRTRIPELDYSVEEELLRRLEGVRPAELLG